MPSDSRTYSIVVLVHRFWLWDQRSITIPPSSSFFLGLELKVCVKNALILPLTRNKSFKLFINILDYNFHFKFIGFNSKTLDAAFSYTNYVLVLSISLLC